MKPHPYRLRTYHNPDNVDESKVDPGWRMLYADEVQKIGMTHSRVWWRYFNDFGYTYLMNPAENISRTFIVPVT